MSAVHGPAKESLPTAFAWSLFGTGFYAACQWGMLALLARIGDQERAETDLGVFVLGLAIASPLVLLMSMQTRTLLAAGRPYPYRAYLSQRVICMGLALAAAIVLAAMAAHEFVLVLTLVAAARAIEGLSDLAYGEFQRSHQMWRVALSQAVRGVGGLVALGAGASIGGSLAAGCTALLGWWVLVAIVVDVRTSNRTGVRVGEVGVAGTSSLRASIRALTVEAAPLGVVFGIVSLTSNLPRYLIADAAGPRVLGVFAALAHAMVAVALVAQALSAAAIPRMGRAFVQGDLSRLRRLVARASLVALAPGAVSIPICVAWGAPLMGFLYRPEFASSGHLLWWFCLLGMLSAVSGMFRAVMTSCAVLKPQLPISAATAGLTGLATWYLLPSGALWAGIGGLLAGRVFQAAAHAVYTARILRGLTVRASG